MTTDIYRKGYVRYGVALAAAALGYLLRLALTRWVGPEIPTYITFYPLVMLAALLGGIGPGIAATAAVALIAVYWVLPPVGSFQIATLHDAVSLAFFSLMGVFMSVVAGLYRRIRSNLEALVATRTQELRDANAALQQVVALFDPARTEIIMQEMQRVMRERDARLATPAPEGSLLRHVPLVAGVLVMCAGLLVLTGWAFDLETFKRVWSGWVPMKANTALCFILAGTALLLRDWKVGRLVLAGTVGAIGVLTLVEYVAGVNLGIDQLFFREVVPAPNTDPGRMAPATALGFLFVSLALSMIKTRMKAARLMDQTLSLAAGMLGTIAVVGYVYKDPGFYGFYGFGGASNVALPTAIAFMVLAAGLIFARTDGLAGVLMGSSSGAQLARRLLPAVLLVPPLLGRLIDYGVRKGVFSDPSGTALFTLTMMLILTVLILWTSGALARADVQRRKNEGQLRNQAELIDQASDALVVRELDGGILFWNRGAEQLYGWPAVEVIGRDMHALLRTESLPPELGAQLRRTGQWEGELQQTMRDGKRILVESRKTAMRTADGRTLVLESTRDITGRRKAEEESARLYAELSQYASTMEHTNQSLAESRRAALNLMEDSVAARELAENTNRELHLLQEKEKENAARLARAQSAADTIRAMHEGVMLLELDGTIISVNPAVERMTGFHGGTVIGRNMEALLPDLLAGADLETAQRGLETMRRGELPEFPPLLLQRPDGPAYRVLPSVSLMDAPESGRRMVVLTLKDVTDLHEATHRLDASERKYRELVENANSIIMRITPDHHITFFNEYAQKFFGYEAAEVLGKTVIGTIVPVVDSDGRDLRQVMRAISTQPELYANNENENMCKDGRRVWVHWSNRAIRNDQGAVAEILCVGTDITRRREMEAEARRYQQRLRDLAERLAVSEEEDRWRISRYIHDTVVQNLSLSNIRLGAMMQPLRDASLKKEADRIIQVRGLLGQAIDECRMVMSDLTPALLYELGLIPALNDLAQRLEAKHGARVVVEAAGRETPVANALRGLLFESARELIMNALKHAGPCEIRVAVNCTVHELILRVSDNGKGMVAPIAPKPADRQGGFGLLNIRQRVTGLGGRLEIVSEPGKGTTASIHVPMGAGENSR
jgi:PAS domain S-box-containing protein